MMAIRRSFSLFSQNGSLDFVSGGVVLLTSVVTSVTTSLLLWM